MKQIRTFAVASLATAALLLVGCGNAAPSTAPPVTGKRPDWKTMTKQEKTDLIKKQPMPEAAREEELRRIESGAD